MTAREAKAESSHGKWCKISSTITKELSFGSISTDWKKFIREFRKAMDK